MGFRFQRALLAAAIGVGFMFGGAVSGVANAQEKLNVWWVKGFYKSEDDALFEAIKKFEAKTGVKVELSQYPVQDMIPKTVAALDSGTPPDVAYADVYDFQVTGKWAYDGKLEDISSVLNPIKDKFTKNTIETTYLYNDKTKKKALCGRKQYGPKQCGPKQCRPKKCGPKPRDAAVRTDPLR